MKFIDKVFSDTFNIFKIRIDQITCRLILSSYVIRVPSVCDFVNMLNKFDYTSGFLIIFWLQVSL